jgi:hypothetical protein
VSEGHRSREHNLTWRQSCVHSCLVTRTQFLDNIALQPLDPPGPSDGKPQRCRNRYEQSGKCPFWQPPNIGNFKSCCTEGFFFFCVFLISGSSLNPRLYDGGGQRGDRKWACKFKYSNLMETALARLGNANNRVHNAVLSRTSPSG